MLIDDIQFPMQWRLAPRFYFDPAACTALDAVFEGVTLDDLLDMRRWAKPPFDRMYIETVAEENAANFATGVMINPDGTSSMLASMFGTNVASGFEFKLNPDEPFPDLWWNPNTSTIGPAPPSMEDDQSLWKEVIGFVSAHIKQLLILNSSSNIVLHSTPNTSKLVKGKRVVYRGHNKVVINIGEARKHVKAFLTGDRGSPRRHGVRGYWVNWHRNTRCDHDFIPREHPRDLESYLCRSCGQIRTWKPSFERGDASKGYVTHEYLVTSTK